MGSLLRLLITMLWSVFLFFTPCLSVESYAQSDSITLVSDTTDEEVCDSMTACVDAPDTVNLSDVQVPSWWRYFLGDGIGWNIAESILSSGAIIMLLMLFCFFLFPILAIILIIYLIMRSSKRHNAQIHSYNNNMQAPPSHKAQNLEKEKDRLVINTALAIGIMIFFVAYQFMFGTLLAVIYLCVQAGRFYNLRRAQKRNNNDENNIEL